MPSTSPSEVILPLVSLRDLNLVLRPDMFKNVSWRDAFTQLLRDPTEILLREKDRLHLLQGISFDVNSGDRIGLLGVNGTGKTTLCRCIAGIYKQTTGTIQVRGKIRAVFDTAIGLNSELTGRENAHMLVEFLYPEESNRIAMAEEALQFADLREFVDAPYRLYSNGMQARLCLSVISCKPCDVLILDEVFEGADTFFSEKVSHRILEMIKQSGAVIFVSHAVEHVRRVCNRVIILEHGKIVFDGGVEPGIERYLRYRP